MIISHLRFSGEVAQTMSVFQDCLPDVQVVSGQNTEAFKRYPYPKLANYSFSLIYKIDGDTRTLDLTCKDEEQFETWFNGIQVI